MNMCVSYNAGEFGDFIRYFCGLHTGQVKKEQIYFEMQQRMSDYLKMHLIMLNPYKNIQIDKKVDKEEFVKLFESKCPPPATHIYKVRLRARDARFKNYHDQYTHNILGTPEYDIMHSLGHKVIWTNLEVLSAWGVFLLNRKELLYSHWNMPFDREWYTEYYRKPKNYPKHYLNHIVQIDELLDYNEDEYNKLIKFLDCKPMDDWKELITEYRNWIVKDFEKPLDNTT